MVYQCNTIELLGVMESMSELSKRLYDVSETSKKRSELLVPCVLLFLGWIGD
jgi:hypothetical protein